MEHYWIVTATGEKTELDAFAFSSEIGKYVDSIAGPLADEATVASLLLRAEEQARTGAGLQLANGSFLRIIDEKMS